MTGPGGESHCIVVVGGGAGGLELAIGLGRRLGRSRRAEVVLIDGSLTHLWKPLLHEVAAGTLDSRADAIDYLALAATHGFRFRLGWMESLDRARKVVHLAPARDESGLEIAPAQEVAYDTLVIAVGSTANDFGVPGVGSHCLLLDSADQADHFHKVFLAQHLHALAGVPAEDAGRLTIAIVGAGATGVELAAELHAANRLLTAYGHERDAPERELEIVLVEAAGRVLPGLPERIAEATETRLRQLGIRVVTDEQVSEVTAEGLRSKGGRFIPARLTVWAAGVKGPEVLERTDGLETNRLGQLVVGPTLQTSRDEAVFAIGDCAACPWPGHERGVPPRAQAASQQAAFLARALAGRLDGRSLPRFVYRDRGSLVSLSGYTALGSIMGNLLGDVTFEGWLARIAYRSLYRQHQRMAYGNLRTALIMLSDWFRRGAGPALKLH